MPDHLSTSLTLNVPHNSRHCKAEKQTDSFKDVNDVGNTQLGGHVASAWHSHVSSAGTTRRHYHLEDLKRL